MCPRSRESVAFSLGGPKSSSPIPPGNPHLPQASGPPEAFSRLPLPRMASAGSRSLPLPLRALNTAGRAARALGLRVLELDAAALQAEASARTGLGDFGDPRFRDPLNLLFESYERDAGLTAFGRLAGRREPLRPLENRLPLRG